ncbi:polysaccharide deacetylase family protein [Nostoc sp. C057]|uniref:polysaccharide deacetylase family protein n=1 Tax=Nostoc sp. C057 TaxID=2576903 RepID=UPI0015C3A104|nr:polysaccharide deacetylase family protein [Nostoc sp. C057]
MINNKQSLWTPGKLVGLLILCGGFSLSLIILSKINLFQLESKQTLNVNNVAANVVTQQRVEEFKTAMLKSWQEEAQVKGFSDSIPSSFQGAIIESAKLSPEQKVIALTFDDGPWPESTAQVLDILKKNQIKGTFFVVGENVKNFPNLLKQEIAEGHVIGNHTWHHWYQFLNPQAAAYEIDHTEDIIFKTTGLKTNLFRPPGGVMHNGVVDYARNSKYAIILWSSDSVDYSRPAVSKLISNAFGEAKPGGIVLMHDGGGNRSRTVQALPEIIANFRNQGYRFVTIPELLQIQDKNQKFIVNKK